ncbi:MAG TPA: hypothetical protein GX747_00070 [Tenericutes bacterium]|nr:hypothetical protein [Mycoplasmatota bacterium]
MFEFLEILSNDMFFYYSLLFISVLAFIIVLILFLRSRSLNKKLKMLNHKEIENNEVNVLNVSKQNVDETDEKENAKLELQKMLDRMQEDLETKTYEVVENFEKEQEEKAIISYQELLRSANKSGDDIYNIDTYNDSTNNFEKTDIDNVNNDYKTTPEYICDKEQNNNKFKSTDFISPIHGRMENNAKFPHIPKINRDKKLEYNNNFYSSEANSSYNNNLDISSLSNEIKKSEDFLNKLKEFRRNL